MPRQITNSLFNSLRGRIWISTSVLAFFICTFGLISYLVVSLLINDVFYGIFIPFLFLAFTVVVFGWWLSNEIVSPIEKVTLLSKSLERTGSATIPKTSGSYETDELLQTISRNSQQIQMLVTLMDKVANGNLDLSAEPLEGSERLNASFKRLLSRVSESINAKEDLDSLSRALESLKLEISPIRSGNLAVTATNDNHQTKEIASTINYLVDGLSRMVALTRRESEDAGDLAKRIERNLRTLLQHDENRIEELNQASIALKQVPNLVQKITDDLKNSADSARQSIGKVHKGAEISARNTDAVSRLRKQMRETLKRVQNLNERSQEIAKLAATVEDLANRTNMVALNASIQATELGENGQGFALVAEEVERLAGRANSTNRQIATLNKSLHTEVRKVENALELAAGEISGFSKYSIENGTILSELERYIGQFLNLQENLLSASQDKAEDTDRVFMTFMNAIADGKSTVDELKNSSGELSELASMILNLQVATQEFRIPEEEKPVEEDEPDGPDSGFLSAAGEEPFIAEEPSVNDESGMTPDPRFMFEMPEAEVVAEEDPVLLEAFPLEIPEDAEGVEIGQYYPKPATSDDDPLGIGAAQDS